MSDLERLANGVLLVGFEGRSLDERLRAQFRGAGFAGYLLFGRNVESLAQVRALNAELRALHDPSVPPILAIDQEGGRVVRLRDGVEPMPSMMALGATGDAELATRAGLQTAHDLRRGGFTLNFAPVLDLATDPMNTVIGTRSFGADPRTVATLASSFAAGMHRGGIVAAYKHFPGHGSTAVDSHVALPHVVLDEAKLRARDVAPFALVARDAAAVMSAHIVADALDPERPATLSYRLLTALLRDELGFGGVCFTDCMHMQAIARGIGTVEGVVAAIAAGADCALVSHDPALALEASAALVEGVKAGRVARERLEQAYDRVIALRARATEPLAIESPAPYPGIGRDIARRAVSVVRGIARAEPRASIVVSFESATSEGAQGLHSEHPSLRQQAPALEEVRGALDPEPGAGAQLTESVARSGRRPLILARRAHMYPAQARAISEIVEAFPEALVASVREPSDIALFDGARHVVATYGDDVAAIGGLADVLFA